MLILTGIDLEARRAEFFSSGCEDERRHLTRVRTIARRLKGWTVRQVDRLEDGPVAGNSPGTDAIATLLVPRIHHRVQRAESGWIYQGVVDHDFTQLEALSTWSAFVLAGFGSQEDHLTQLHVALYEICANVLEHGQVLSPSAQLRVTLEMGEGAIRGKVEDHCERFDTCARSGEDLDDLLRRRRRRGYGLAMIRSLLDDCRHEYEAGVGNRLTFHKEVRQ